MLFVGRFYRLPGGRWPKIRKIPDDSEAKVNAYPKAPSRFLNIIELKPRPQHQFAELTLSAEENPESFIVNFFGYGLAEKKIRFSGPASNE